MIFDSKFKINLYHEHFPETSEKYIRSPKFTPLFSMSYVRIKGKTKYAAKFAAAFYGV